MSIYVEVRKGVWVKVPFRKPRANRKLYRSEMTADQILAVNIYQRQYRAGRGMVKTNARIKERYPVRRSDITTP